MFKGVVAHIGEDLKKKPGFDLKEGDKIVSLVSLSMTPLKIDKILAIHKDIDRVDIVGKAILFESALYLLPFSSAMINFLLINLFSILWWGLVFQ